MDANSLRHLLDRLKLPPHSRPYGLSADVVRSLVARIGPTARGLYRQRAIAEARPVRQITASEIKALILQLRDKLARAIQGGAFLNVWAVSGLGRNEVRNAGVLAWLLDPRQTHGLGSAVVAALYSILRERFPYLPTVTFDRQYTAVRTERYLLANLDNRVDIVVETRSAVLMLEVKIDAAEGASQTLRYSENAIAFAKALGKDHGIVVYLSTVEAPITSASVPWLTWIDVGRALDSLTATGSTASVIQQYRVHIHDFRGSYGKRGT